MRSGYIRLSRRGPDLDAQSLGVRGHGATKLYTDEKRRAGLEQRDHVVRALREGDVLVIYSLDRLSPNEAELLRVVERIDEKKATLVCIEPPLDTAEPGVMQAFRAIKKARERWRSERAPDLSSEAARRRGKRGKGLRKLLDPEDLILARRNWFDPDFPTKRCAELAGLGQMTLYRRFGPRTPQPGETDEQYEARMRGRRKRGER